jgi:hypothetical protein
VLKRLATHAASTAPLLQHYTDNTDNDTDSTIVRTFSGTESDKIYVPVKSFLREMGMPMVDMGILRSRHM